MNIYDKIIYGQHMFKMLLVGLVTFFGAFVLWDQVIFLQYVLQGISIFAFSATILWGFEVRAREEI